MKKHYYISFFLFLMAHLLFSQDFNGFNTVLRTNKLTSAPYYVEIDYPSTLTGLIARYRADDLSTIYDNSCKNDKKFPEFANKTGIIKKCKNANQKGFIKNVFQWLDISGNKNHLTAYNKYRSDYESEAAPLYIPNDITNPSYSTNATVSGDGINDHLYKDINPNLDGDFTFIFVMRATNPSPGTYDSFIASSSSTNQNNPKGPQIAGAWQISTNNNTSNLYFGYCYERNRGTIWLELLNFDTNVHVYYIQYDVSETRLTISIDGITKIIHTVDKRKTGPIIDELRLFRNRNMNTNIAAAYHEFFLANRIFTNKEKLKVTNYLIAKWGVNI